MKDLFDRWIDRLNVWEDRDPLLGMVAANATLAALVLAVDLAGLALHFVTGSVPSSRHDPQRAGMDVLFLAIPALSLVLVVTFPVALVFPRTVSAIARIHACVLAVLGGGLFGLFFWLSFLVTGDYGLGGNFFVMPFVEIYVAYCVLSVFWPRELESERGSRLLGIVFWASAVVTVMPWVRFGWRFVALWNAAHDAG